MRNAHAHGEQRAAQPASAKAEQMASPSSIFSQTPTISLCSEAFLTETPSDSGPLAPGQEGPQSAYLQGGSHSATALLSLSVGTHLLWLHFFKKHGAEAHPVSLLDL